VQAFIPWTKLDELRRDGGQSTVTCTGNPTTLLATHGDREAQGVGKCRRGNASAFEPMALLSISRETNWKKEKGQVCFLPLV
jgi:hypothetical protein